MRIFKKAILSTVLGLALSASVAGHVSAQEAEKKEGGWMPNQEASTIQPTPPQDVLNIENRAQIEALIEQYIMNNPQVIIDSLEKYGADQRKADAAKTRNAVKENADWLFNNKDLPTAGNPDASVTLVEFFDYNCGYCKRALTDIMKLLEEDDDLRVVFVDLPILGPSSIEAAKWSIAAQRQGRYLEYHIAVMEHRSRLNEASLESLAEKVGLDVEQAKKDVADPAIVEKLDSHIEKARVLGVTGTPAFAIGEEMAKGYVGFDALKSGIAQFREDMKKKEAK